MVLECWCVELGYLSWKGEWYWKVELLGLVFKVGSWYVVMWFGVWMMMLKVVNV